MILKEIMQLAGLPQNLKGAIENTSLQTDE